MASTIPISKEDLNARVANVQVKPIQDKDRLILVANVGFRDVGTYGLNDRLHEVTRYLERVFDDSVKILTVPDPDSTKVSFYCPNAVLGDDSKDILNDVANAIKKKNNE